jgi:threonine aldolase
LKIIIANQGGPRKAAAKWRLIAGCTELRPARRRAGDIMDFASDNTAGASQVILAAVLAANESSALAYGTDPWTAKAPKLLDDVFERPIAGFLVSTGTAANALALGALSPPFGAVFCHSQAHVMEDECGAPEMFTGGAKLVGIPGRAGKIAPADLTSMLANFQRGLEKQVQPAALSLSQFTECGTIYTRGQLAELTTLAHDAGLMVHMDGARFPPMHAGRNELEGRHRRLIVRRHEERRACLRGGYIFRVLKSREPALPAQTQRTYSKGRFLGAQMTAYLKNGHWLDLAAAANGHARRLAQDLGNIPGVRLPWPCEANEIFAILPRAIDMALKAGGALYYPWEFRDFGAACAPPAEDEVFVRLVTSFATLPSDVDDFLSLARSA